MGIEHLADIIVQSIWSVVLIVGLAWFVEQRHPIEPRQSRSDIFLEYRLILTNIVLKRLVAPLSGVLMAMVVNMVGGGFITLRGDGWWFPLSFAIIIFIVEVEGYWIHRLQHSVPFLWSMHSLHHSAEAMTAATGARHYWVEGAILAALLPSAAMLFKFPPEVLRIVPYFFITEQLAHMNAKVQLGPLTLVLNNPQFHRIHHSVEPQHYDKNFCKNLPIMDIIFGTAWIPAKDEFPRTGLLTKEKPESVLEGIIWPIRRVPAFRKLVGLTSENPSAIGSWLYSKRLFGFLARFKPVPSDARKMKFE